MRSIEHLSHFQCCDCSGWFSIGDAPVDRHSWWCPWCGALIHYEPAMDPSPDGTESLLTRLKRFTDHSANEASTRLRTSGGRLGAPPSHEELKNLLMRIRALDDPGILGCGFGLGAINVYVRDVATEDRIRVVIGDVPVEFSITENADLYWLSTDE